MIRDIIYVKMNNRLPIESQIHFVKFIVGDCVSRHL